MKTLLKKGQKFDLGVRRQYSLFQVASILPKYIDLAKSVLGTKATMRFEVKDGWVSFYLVRKEMDLLEQHYVGLIESGKPFLVAEIAELDKTGEA